MAGTCVITQTGRGITTGRLIGATPTQPPPKFVGWGTGTNAAATTQTTLQTESPDEARVSGTPTQVTTTTANDTLQVVGTMTCATNAKSISEAGVFDATPGGNMFMRGQFTAQSLNPGDSITFTFTAQFSS